MQEEQLKFVMEDQRQKLLLKPTGIEREMLYSLLKESARREMVIISGVRRCGKSTLLLQLIKHLLKDGVGKDNILYLNFEDERLSTFSSEDFQTLYEAFLQLHSPNGKVFLFLDEIQNVKNWEKWANRMYEFEDVKIYLTGSNASLLRSEVSTALTGRNMLFVEFPFSFSELAPTANKYTTEGSAKLKSTFNNYVEFGGFPEAFSSKRKEILLQYLHDIISRDIMMRYSIRDKRAFEEFIFYLLNLYGKRMSYGKMGNVFKIGSKNTIKKFVGYAMDSYLVFAVNKHSISAADAAIAPRKIYVIDHALARQVSTNPLEDKGSALENMVYINLARQLRLNESISYWVDGSGNEVDFLVKKGIKVTDAIQVSYAFDGRKDREVSALVNALKKFKLKRGTIVTYEYESVERIDKKVIAFVPAAKWLLRER